MKTIYSYVNGMQTSLLIVGNGFDCSLKAKTRYEEFYAFLLNCYNSPSLEKFIVKIGGKYNREDLELFFNLLKAEASTNYFINYFISYNKAFNCWVDFEKELKRIVTSFDDLVTVLKNSEKIYYSGYDLYIRIMDNINLLSVISNYSDNRFFKSEIASKELYSFDIKGANTDSFKNLYNGINTFVESFPRELYKDLSSFSKMFSLYLFIIRDDASYKIEHDFIRNCSVAINYNYTDYLSHYCVRKDDELSDILYINGKIDSDGTSDSIVFGIDSNVKIANSDFFIFTKTAQRSAKNVNVRQLAEIVNRSLINRIIVFGHSLNTADKDTLEFVFKECGKHSKSQVEITVYCYDEKSKLNIISNLKEILGLKYYTDLQMNGKLLLKDI